MDPTPGRGPSAGQTLGHYRLLERIGAGGMGEVWRARDERLERDVALKLLLPGLLADEVARKRFRREALSLSQLNHPSIATVFDFNTEAGADFLVMEYVAGPVVTERLAQGPLPEAEVARLGVQLAEGLAAAHGQGIIHRDLKPANVRLTPDGRLKILDFGLAKLVRPTDGRSPTDSLTEAQALIGTLAFMAPEQVRGEAVDARSDLWAAGLVLYELATGVRAYKEGRSAQVIYAILNQTPAPPRVVNPHVSAGLEAIILKCLEREPGQRYPGAAELAADLQRLLGGLTVQAERSRVRARRVRTLGIAFPVTVVVVLAVLAALNVGGLRTRMFTPPPIRSIAVLPLANLSGDASQEYFADGMTEALINDLGQVSALRVISRTSAMAYKGAKKPLKQIARELGVDAVVEGSVSRSGDRVRISAQLIRVKEERQLWAQSYERGLRDVLVMQGQIARAIVEQVRAKLTADQATRLASAKQVDPEAYDVYLRAKRGPGYRPESERLYRRAIELDPEFALAYAALSSFYSGKVLYPGTSPGEVAPLALDAASKALQLDPNLAEAHAAMAMAKLHFEWDWREAEAGFRRALELNPNSYDAIDAYRYYLVVAGRAEESIPLAMRMCRAQPNDATPVLQVGWCSFYARHDDAALKWFRKSVAMNPFAENLAWLAIANAFSGNMKEALAGCDSLTRAENPFPESIGYIYAIAGRREKALGVLKALRAEEERQYVDPVRFAILYAGLGDRDRAIAELQRAVAVRSISIVWLKAERYLDGLRSDPRYQELLARTGPPAPTRTHSPG